MPRIHSIRRMSASDFCYADSRCPSKVTLGAISTFLKFHCIRGRETCQFSLRSPVPNSLLVHDIDLQLPSLGPPSKGHSCWKKSDRCYKGRANGRQSSKKNPASKTYEKWYLSDIGVSCPRSRSMIPASHTKSDSPECWLSKNVRHDDFPSTVLEI